MSSYSYQYYNVNDYKWRVAEIKSKLEEIKKAEKNNNLINGDLTVVSNSVFTRIGLQQGYVAEATRNLQAIGAIVLVPENKGIFGHEITELFTFAVWNYQIVNGTTVPPFKVGNNMVTFVMSEREQVPVPQYRSITSNLNTEGHLPGGQIMPGTGGGDVGNPSSSQRQYFDKYGKPIQTEGRQFMRDKDGNVLCDKNGNPLYTNSRK